jgi:hypothetical protein
VARLLRGQEDQQRGDIGRRAQAHALAQLGRQRLAARHRLGIGRERRHRGDHLGIGHRHDGVDRDAGLGAFHGPGAREARDAGLGRRVAGLAEVATLAGRRGHQQQAPALPLLAHAAHGRAGTGEGAAQVGVDDGVEVLVAHVPQHAVAQDAGIGAQDVEPAPGVDGLADQAIGRFGRAHRHDLVHRLAPLGQDGGDGGLGRGGIDVVDHDAGSGAGQGLREGQSEAAATAGDDGHLAAQADGFRWMVHVVLQRPR